MNEIKNSIINLMKEKNSPLNVEEIKLHIADVRDKKIIFDVLSSNDDFFCLTKKVWYLKQEVNTIVEDAIKELTVKGHTNKYGYVYFKDIYDYVRDVLDKNNISMDRLVEAMEQNLLLSRGKNTRWWKLQDDISEVKRVIKPSGLKVLSHGFNPESLTEESLDGIVMQYFNDVRIPVSEEELCEDLKYVLSTGEEDENNLRKLVGIVLSNRANYMKIDTKRWVPRNFMMYDEYKANFKEQIDEIIEDMQERHKYIFKARNGLQVERITYQSIGDQLGISKQRVTQIYEKVMEEIKRHNNVFLVYAEILEGIVRVNDSVMSLEHFFAEIEKLDEFKEVHPKSIVWMFQSGVFNWNIKYDENEHIIFIDSIPVRTMFQIVNDLFERNLIEDKTSIIDVSEVLKSGKNLKSKLVKYYLSCFPYINYLGGQTYYIKKNAKLTRFDFIYMTLHKTGEPMHFDRMSRVINKEFKKDYDPRDIQSALIAHADVYIRSSSGTYGLRKWGLKEDIYVKDACYKVLLEHGAPMYYEDITREVMKIKAVKAKTAYQSLVLDERIEGMGDGRYYLKEWKLKKNEH